MWPSSWLICPRDALWVEGQRTSATGLVRDFESPPLTPGKKYLYTVRTAWYENGKWVGQSVEVPVRSEAVAVYLERTPAQVTKAR